MTNQSWTTATSGINGSRAQAPAISRIEVAEYDGHSLRIFCKTADFVDQKRVKGSEAIVLPDNGF